MVILTLSQYDGRSSPGEFSDGGFSLDSLEEEIICRDRFGEPVKRKEAMLLSAKTPMEKGELTVLIIGKTFISS